MVLNNYNSMQKWKSNHTKKDDVNCLEDFGIKPMKFTETMDGVFGNHPKEYIRDFLGNEVIQYLWQSKEFHEGHNSFTDSPVARCLFKDHKSTSKIEKLLKECL